LYLEGLSFRGLRELILFHLPYADHASWLPCLAQLLKDSPGLKKLGLGLDRGRPRHKAGLVGLFDRLCDLYASNGGSPLSLKSLELTGGLYLDTVASGEKLTDLACLHDVYISNAVVPAPERIAFKAFAPPHAPNLRYFRVDDYHKAVHEHICAISDPLFMRKLGLAYRRTDWRHGGGPLDLLQPNRQHPSLPLQVRMIDLELCRPTFHEGRNKFEPDDEQLLETLVATNADTLEGLAVATVGPGTNDADTERCVQLLERALRSLPNLTQLAVEATWPSGHNMKAAQAIGERLALAGPRLRFINMGIKFWRVWRDADDGTVSLVRIKTREADRIELWKQSLINLTPITRMY
jgi:hypothetical protein